MVINVKGLRELQGRIDEFKIEVKNEAEDMVRRIAFAVDSTVVRMSPVDTGRFRANWQVTMSAPATGTVDHVPGKGGSSTGANTRKALDQLQMVMKNYELGKPVFIVNNVVYGPRLNDGHSKQAPRNFLKIAVEAGIVQAKR